MSLCLEISKSTPVDEDMRYQPLLFHFLLLPNRHAIFAKSSKKAPQSCYAIPIVSSSREMLKKNTLKIQPCVVKSHNVYTCMDRAFGISRNIQADDG